MRATAGHLERLDPVVATTRQANRLLEQYGEEEVFALDESGHFVDDADIIGDPKLVRHYEGLGTPEVESEDGEYGIFLDHVPLLSENLPLVEIGHVALHIIEYGVNDEQLDADQIVFRQENHGRGAAIFVGEGMIPIEDPKVILQIQEGLLKVEELLWAQATNDLNSAVNTYPKSELTAQFNELLSLEAENG